MLDVQIIVQIVTYATLIISSGAAIKVMVKNLKDTKADNTRVNDLEKKVEKLQTEVEGDKKINKIQFENIACAVNEIKEKQNQIETKIETKFENLTNLINSKF